MLSHVGLTLVVLWHCAGLVDSQNNITANPSDVSALLGAVVTFQCRYSGVLPIWDVFIRVGSSLPSDPTETLTPEEVEILQPEGYLNHTSSEGGVSTLEVLATRELNNSQFQCRILVSSQIRSAPATLTVDGEPQPPEVITVREVEHNLITVTWSEPYSSAAAPVLGYIAQLIGGASQNVTGVDNRMATFDGLLPNTSYTIRVAAYNSVGTGEFGQVQQATRVPDVPPPPTGLSRMITITAGDPTIIVSWEAPVLGPTQSEITQYIFRFKLFNESSYSITTVFAPTRQLNFQSAQLGRRYSAFVTARNAGGLSNGSEILTLTATYLQSVSFEEVPGGVNISCEFAESDQDLMCMVNITGTRFSRSITISPIFGSSPPVASFLTADLPQEMLTYSAVALSMTDGEPIEDFRANGMANLSNNGGGTTGLLLTDEQIFIIVGVIAGTLVLIVILVAIIFVIVAISDRKKGPGRKRTTRKRPRQFQDSTAPVHMMQRTNNTYSANVSKSEPDTGDVETFNC